MNKYFGIVEGFFSEPLKPWTYIERMTTLDFVNTYASGINTYLYCPKDDKYIRKNWDKLYSKDQQRKLNQFIKKCTDKHIMFIYGLNPNIQNNVDWIKIKKQTIRKLEQTISLGSKKICLLFDDIPLSYDVVDGNVNKNILYKDLIDYINEIYIYFKNKINDFWLCLPDYTFNKMTPLTQECKRLDKNIVIIWSGNNIFSKKITLTDIQRVEKILFPKVRLLYWSNYPVNDCEQALGTFNLGGFYPVKQAVLKCLSGIIVNPMREPYANLPFYITFSRYILEPPKYSRNKGWTSALKLLGLASREISLINTFSSCNSIDKCKKNIKSSPVTVKIGKVNNMFGRKFIRTIKQIFIDALSYNDLAKMIIENKTIKEKLFSQWDWFPTKTYISYFFLEIVTIVTKRYFLYKTYFDTELLKQNNKFIEYFKSTYKGQQKLNITKQDDILIKKYIKQLIIQERRLFLKILNRADIPNNKKIQILYKRRNINRFT